MDDSTNPELALARALDVDMGGELSRAGEEEAATVEVEGVIILMRPCP
jgi:hypothetical protein